MILLNIAVCKDTGKIDTFLLGFIADYIAEIFHNELRPLNFTDVHERLFSFDANVGHRDRKAVMRTVSGLIKLIHPDGKVSKDELAEYLTFALEMRRRVKEQLRRINPMEFAKTDLTFIDKAMAGLSHDEAVVKKALYVIDNFDISEGAKQELRDRVNAPE